MIGPLPPPVETGSSGVGTGVGGGVYVTTSLIIGVRVMSEVPLLSESTLRGERVFISLPTLILTCVLGVVGISANVTVNTMLSP